MKSILCFGDSNTWGWNPVTQDRYGRDERWAGVLRNHLGEGYHVIEEGQNGRTTVWDDPVERHKNGSVYLPPCLESHKPLDLVIIMLGTNDLKMRFSIPACDIARSAGVLVDIVQKSGSGLNSGSPEVLLIAPPPLAKLTDFAEMLEGGTEKSHKLGEYYRQTATEYGCHFLDAGKVIVSSDLDGVHFDLGEHKKLGEAVAAKVKEILG
ncbi:MAG: SGNH/GDSL hydrolase family protein [Caldilineales bacterium]|nr:SGNH/GDSL hydrolase family protein [Caldilineales bacterium]